MPPTTGGGGRSRPAQSGASTWRLDVIRRASRGQTCRNGNMPQQPTLGVGSPDESRGGEGGRHFLLSVDRRGTRGTPTRAMFAAARRSSLHVDATRQRCRVVRLPRPLVSVAVLGATLRFLAAATAATAAHMPHVGVASSYNIPGGILGCGGTLETSTMEVASRTLPCGTRLRICYAARCVRARVRDRGPFVAGRDFDLNVAVVRALGFGSATAWGVRTIRWRVA